MITLIAIAKCAAACPFHYRLLAKPLHNSSLPPPKLLRRSQPALLLFHRNLLGDANGVFGIGFRH